LPNVFGNILKLRVMAQASCKALAQFTIKELFAVSREFDRHRFDMVVPERIL